ncbi:MAG: hypothetical protein LUG86_08945 [Oscillospiraceae bacterium]|nr:hypothetical protein [Oscillospiraceae bacterium]
MFEEFDVFFDKTESTDVPERQEIDESDAPKPSFHLATTNNPDMPEVLVGGVPELWAEKLDSEQGDNEFEIEQCCGLVTVSNILQMAGIDKTEDNIVEYALDHRLCRVRPFHWSQSGGSTVYNQQKLLEVHGVESDIYLPTEIDYEQMASWVENGRGVVLNHSVYMTIDGMEDRARTFFGKPLSNHAVTMTGTVRDPDGELLGFTVCDSGARDGMRFISLDQMDAGFKDAFGSSVLVTSDPIHDNGKPLLQTA